MGIAILVGPFARALAQETRHPSTIAAIRQASSESSSGSERRADQPALQRRSPRYQLSKGDTVDLNFPFTPEFNQIVIVNPDGFITLTGVGDLYVAGKVVPELRELLQTVSGKIV